MRELRMKKKENSVGYRKNLFYNATLKEGLQQAVTPKARKTQKKILHQNNQQLSALTGALFSALITFLNFKKLCWMSMHDF